MSARYEPATRIIASLGGVSVVARYLGKDTSTIRRWRMAVENGGTGGVIPESERAPLLMFAEQTGIALEYADFAPALSSA